MIPLLKHTKTSLATIKFNQVLIKSRLSKIEENQQFKLPRKMNSLKIEKNKHKNKESMSNTFSRPLTNKKDLNQL
jgi:hypothetical protein